MGFKLDLTFYGALKTLPQVAEFAKKSGEKRIVYLARSAQIDDMNKVLGRPPVRDADVAMLKQAKVAYIGITAAEKISERFRRHHKLNAEFLQDNGLVPITEFYVGTIKQRSYKPPQGVRHEIKLTNLENLLIGWFVPPLNVHGIRTIPDEDGNPQRWGVGPAGAIEVNISFKSPGGTDIATPHKSFPRMLGYNTSSEEIYRQ